MRKISIYALLSILSLGSCTKEFNYDPTEDIKTNAQAVFGLIDPNQDWRTVNSGTVTITANADLDDIAKVQILTESPFFNDNAKVLAEVDASAGQTVTLNYSAPREYETLIAACVDSKGHHFIKPFSLNTKSVSFSTTAANTRALTRAEAGIDISHLTLDKESVKLSLNAGRTIYSYMAENTGDPYMNKAPTDINLWKGSNWENEKLWQLSTSSTVGDGWNVVEGTVVRNINAMTPEEESILKAIYDKFLVHKDGGKRLDNLAKIRNSSAVKLFNSHLTSDGQPFTIIPIQMASSDLPNCTLYYYYYNPQTVPTDISLEDYIKQLPKYKAVPCAYTRDASGVGEYDFFKVHEYLLPYYGDLMPTTTTITPKDGVYRIRNIGKTNANHNDYITYLGANYYNCDKLAKAYSSTTDKDKLENQIWQIFELGDDRCLLYNIGSKQFLTSVGDYIESKNNWGTFFTDCLPFVKEHPFKITTDADGTKISSYDFPTTYLGANSANNHRIATNKTKNDKQFINWEIKEYEDAVITGTLKKLTIEADITDRNAVSDCIPAGYRVGFMLQKANKAYAGEYGSYLKAKDNGCTFGNGELNKIINNFPDHFSNAQSMWHMEPNDTRIAMFNANNKTYLSFEDGSDTNFSDLIIEVTGRAGRMFDDVQEVEGLPYTMCFEDRPNVADYDMNDVVLSCKRLSPTQIELSLIAAGAQDQVKIEGIEGNFVSGTKLNDQEVHALFGVPNDTFVNTQLSDQPVNPVTAIYEIGEFTTIPQFLTNIYIRNITQGGNEIHVPLTGEPPFALIVPGNFDYPIEKVSIISAYTTFRNWANNANNYGEWVNFYDESKIYPNPLSNRE